MSETVNELKRLRNTLTEQEQRVKEAKQRLDQIEQSIAADQVSNVALDKARAAVMGNQSQFDAWIKQVVEVKVLLNHQQINDLVEPKGEFLARPRITDASDYYTRQECVVVFVVPVTCRIIQLSFRHNNLHGTNYVYCVSDSEYDTGYYLERATAAVPSTLTARYDLRTPVQQAVFVTCLMEFTRSYLEAIGRPLTMETYRRLMSMLK